MSFTDHAQLCLNPRSFKNLLVLFDHWGCAKTSWALERPRSSPGIRKRALAAPYLGLGWSSKRTYLTNRSICLMSVTAAKCLARALDVLRLDASVPSTVGKEPFGAIPSRDETGTPRTRPEL